MQKQQQDKIEEQRRRELEFERLKLYQQAQREEEERRKFELRKKQESANNRQINFEQLTKTMENRNQSSTMDIDPFLAFQQATIEAQQ
jgi:hypothetical protein